MATHFLTKSATELFRDSLGDGHRGNTPWLGAADLALDRVAGLGEVLRYLRCLTGTSLTDDNQNLVVMNCLVDGKKFTD